MESIKVVAVIDLENFSKSSLVENPTEITIKTSSKIESLPDAVSLYLKQNKDSVTSFKVSGTMTETKRTVMDKETRELTIKDNPSSTMRQLFDFVKSAPNITKLDFAGCQFGTNGAQELASVIKGRSFDSLNLSGNRLRQGDIGSMELDSCAVKSLDLSNNSIPENEATRMVKKRGLETLNLEGNNFVSSKFVGCLTSAGERLKTLYLGGNNINSKAIEELTKVLPEAKTLERISLTNSLRGIDPAQLDALSKAAPKIKIEVSANDYDKYKEQYQGKAGTSPSAASASALQQQQIGNVVCAF